MWNRRTTSLLAATAAGLTLSLTGCGAGSSTPGAAVAPSVNGGRTQAPAAQAGTSSGPAPSTQLVSWASGMCRAVAAHNQKVTPATIDRSDPTATLTGMSRMFGKMAGMLAAQHRELEKLPAPRSAADRAAFRHSLVRLTHAEAVMHRAQHALLQGLTSRSPDIVSTLRSAGTLAVDGKVYPGFVVDLADRESHLKAAISAASACHGFSVA